MSRELPIRNGRLVSNLDANGKIIINLGAGFLPNKADLENGKVPDSELPTYVNAAAYDSQAKKIYLKHGDDVVAEVDATAFIKDGMVSSVAVSGGNLVITFNTDAGKQPISIPLSSFIQYSSDNPAMDGAASPGSAQTAARSDHVHPHDSTRLPTSGGTMTGGLTIANGNCLRLADSSGVIDIYRNYIYGWRDLNTEREPDYTIQIADANGWLAFAESLAAEYSGMNSYSVGDSCVYKGKLYRCTTVITTPEEFFNPLHWTETTIDYYLGVLRIAIGAKYALPSGGIPKTDLASGVQTSLGKADTAVQPEAGKGLFSGSYTDLTNKPPLGTAAAKDVPASGNASSSQVVMGDDTLLSDSRTPTAHKNSHKTGGSDALSPADIGAAPASDLPYSFQAATVGLAPEPTVTDLANRAINYATLGSTVTAATVTLPAAVPGRSRDFYIDITIEATDAPTLTFIDPATNTTANIAFGADSLADIAPGYNLVLWTGLPNNRWLVSAKHKEAS